MERRLAAILAADVVGYSRLVRADEEATLRAMKSIRNGIIEPLLAQHRGRLVKLMGDGILVEFNSAVEAVRAAIGLQEAMAGYGANEPPIDWRIGVNLGDVVVDGDDIHGDGVNVAARLEALADAGTVCISDAVHEQVRDRIDVRFEDLGFKQVKNIDRPLRAWQWRPKSGAAQSAPLAALALPDKPSIAVLPLENRSADPDQAYFSDGITDDIITELSRYNELFVIARHSAFAYRGRSLRAEEVARELGVQYILEGSVRRAGKRIRVTAQLVDAIEGNHLWAERYDGDLEDIFALQDEITGVIVNTLVGQVTRQHHRRALAKSPHASDAYAHALKAMELLWKVVGPDNNLRALEEAEKAVDLDPKFSRAYAMIAWCHVSDGSNLWSEDPAMSFDCGFEAAKKAVDADDREPWGHLALGWAHIWRDRAHNQALAELRRAIALKPGNAHFRAFLAWALGWAGRPEEALRELEVAMRLNPHHPLLYSVFTARALFHLERYDEALAQLGGVVTGMAGHNTALALMVACHAARGRMDDARAASDLILRNSPHYSMRYVRSSMPYAKTFDLEKYAGLVRLAGLPD